MCPSSCIMSKPISGLVPSSPLAYRIVLVLFTAVLLSSWDSIIRQFLLASSFCYDHSEAPRAHHLTPYSVETHQEAEKHHQLQIYQNSLATVKKQGKVRVCSVHIKQVPVTKSRLERKTS